MIPRDDERDAQHLERLLGGGRVERGDRPPSDPDLDPLSGDLDTLRARLEPLLTPPALPPRRRARLVARILRSTTREDLSWRGELHLLGSFVRERFLHSRALKWVAASLVVHLLGLPFFAAQLLRSPAPPQVRISFTPAPTDGPLPFDDAPSVAEAVEPVPALPAGIDPARYENAVRRDRYRLTTAQVPAAPGPAPGGEAPLEVRLLEARAELWRNRALPPWSLRAAEFATASPAARALWVDLWLDAYVLTGQAPRQLPLLLNQLALRASTPLERRALTRAFGYGLWKGPLGFRPEDAPPPVDREWKALWAASVAGTPAAAHPWTRAWTR